MATPDRDPARADSARRDTTRRGGEAYMRHRELRHRIVQADPDFLDHDHGADGATYTVGWDNTTSGVAGNAIGVLFAAKTQTMTAAQVAQALGGTMPSAVDIHLSVGPNPSTLLSTLGLGDKTVRAGLFQVGTDANGNTTLTQLYAGPLSWGSQLTIPSVTIDPNGGGLALFTANTGDPVTFAPTAPGAAAPAPNTPGGVAPGTPPNPNPQPSTNKVWIFAGVVLAVVLGITLLEWYGIIEGAKYAGRKLEGR
jgi:hypothetical protein